jgi:hypothetical protein
VENGRTTRCVGKHRQMIRPPRRARGKITLSKQREKHVESRNEVKWDERRRKESGEEIFPGPVPRKNMGPAGEW